MSLTLTSPTPTPESAKSLEDAILETLAYSDIFDYPLTLDELHKYLVISATKDEVKKCIEKMNQVSFEEGHYFLSPLHVTLSDSEGSLPISSETLHSPKSGSFRVTHNIVQTRKQREIKSKKIFNHAMVYGKIIAKFPFVKMVALTGSLAMLNLSDETDMDFMLVTAHNRLWLARAFTVTFGRLIRLLGDRICINLLIPENNLHWSQHDLYSAREICQMIPIAGFDTYNNFRLANSWVEEFLPNTPLESINMESIGYVPQRGMPIDQQKLASAGQSLENLAMKIQLKIISKRSEISDETNFTADICQGNFHQHKKWTQIEYEKRLQTPSLRAAFFEAKQ